MHSQQRLGGFPVAKGVGLPHSDVRAPRETHPVRHTPRVRSNSCKMHGPFSVLRAPQRITDEQKTLGPCLPEPAAGTCSPGHFLVCLRAEEVQATD